MNNQVTLTWAFAAYAVAALVLYSFLDATAVDCGFWMHFVVVLGPFLLLRNSEWFLMATIVVFVLVHFSINAKEKSVRTLSLTALAILWAIPGVLAYVFAGIHCASTRA